MPSDDSLFTNSLKRRFRKAIAESTERPAASTGPDQGDEGASAPTSAASASQPEAPAPPEENMDGEVETRESPAAPGDASETANEQPIFNEVGHSLAELFSRKAVSDPLVRALLERHAAVDARELTDELDQFARDIGARTDRPKEVQS